MASKLAPLLLVLLAAPAVLPLPLVDSGLFVILGVNTCRGGSGYCLLGSDCTLDHDFAPDDSGGHCDGLRSAFTPAANFVCCKYDGASGPVNMPETTTSSPAPTVASTTKATPMARPGSPDPPKPSKRPTPGGSIKPAPSSDEAATGTPGAIFWVDLNSSSPGANTIQQQTPSSPGSWPGLRVGGAATHPASSLVSAGNLAGASPVAVASNVNVPIGDWLAPGGTVGAGAIAAAKPGSSVTLGVGAANQLLDEIVQQAVGSEVSHGVSITQQETEPSLQLDAEPEEADAEVVPVGAIEAHEPTEPSVASVKPSKSPATTTAAPVTQRPQKPQPVAEEEEEEESEAEDSDEEGSEEEEDEEEEEEEDDDGLFGFSDLVELLGLDTAQKAGAAQVSAKNESGAQQENDADAVIESKIGEQSLQLQERLDEVPHHEETHSDHMVGGFLANSPGAFETSTLPLGGLFTSSSSTAATEATSTAAEEDEEPPLCFGPVRTAPPSACWAALIVDTGANGGNLCWGARVANHLVVVSAACAVRISSVGLSRVQVMLPGVGGVNGTTLEVKGVEVHDEYHAAPHLALNDLGLVKLRAPEAEPGDGCTLCLSQDLDADFSHFSCETPSLSTEGTVALVTQQVAQRGTCRTLVGATGFVCSTPGWTSEPAGEPLVCRGRRGIPLLAGVRSASGPPGADAAVFTPVGDFAEWLRGHQMALRSL